MTPRIYSRRKEFISMLAIIDYGAGNLRSVENAFALLGVKTVVTSEASEILSADHVVLPGVGAFQDAMEKLGETGLAEVVKEVVRRRIPLLGICLGLQLLFDSSEESPGVKGLSIFPGRVLRIPNRGGQKVPHMGWNSLLRRADSRLLRGIPEEAYVYFVHSYYLQADHSEIVAATTEYGVRIHAAVECGQVFACQFHPEKSGEIGLQILKNFSEL